MDFRTLTRGSTVKLDNGFEIWRLLCGQMFVYAPPGKCFLNEPNIHMMAAESAAEARWIMAHDLQPCDEECTEGCVTE